MRSRRLAAAGLAAALLSLAATSSGQEAAAPPRIPRPRSPAMVETGLVMIGLGAFTVVTGALTLQRAAGERMSDGGRAAPFLLGGGGVVVAIGIPLWRFGAAPSPD